MCSSPWDTIEPDAQRQILNTARMPFVFRHVAVMPDCHFGKGGTVGTVLPTRGAVIPAAVGADIGCGMIAVRTTLTRGDIANPGAVRAAIARRIPMSAGRNNKQIVPTAAPRVRSLEQQALAEGARPDQFAPEWRLALGTLGGGNHFIELAEDTGGRVWVTLHSGSRGVGSKIGTHYIRTAQDVCRQHRVTLPDRDLAYLPDDHPAFDEYLRHLHWAQQFAFLNRTETMDRVMAELSRAMYGEAGRRYSRTKARQLFTMHDLDAAMRGIEDRRSQVLPDEIPSAHKDIDQVMEYAKDLVEVKEVLKQFINVKGD